MIKFRNSGTNFTTQIGIMRLLYDAFDGVWFDLDDFASELTNNDMMTAYGFTGNAALQRSNVKDSSRNSTKMNAKLYAEVLRMLGWISSFEAGSAYPVIITQLGRYVATSREPMRLFEQSLLGICSPQEMMEGVRYNEHVRFFLCALRTLEALGGTMYKHELCMGPMSVNDDDPNQFDSMINQLKTIRGSYDSYNSAWKHFCSELGMTSQSVDNQTRFPKAALSSCGWVSDMRTSSIYPPKSLKCFSITDKGKAALASVRDCKDLRLDEYLQCSVSEQDALIRLGFYEMLARAGYDTSPVRSQMSADATLVTHITGGRTLLFSPYQVLKSARVNAALGVESSHSPSPNEAIRSFSQSNVSQSHPHRATVLKPTVATVSSRHSDVLGQSYVNKIKKLSQQNLTDSQIVSGLFADEAQSNQDTFYPLVAALFRILGFACHASRQGDNGSRMDAIITGPGNAVPIEIKSPGEEQFISVKAVKQAIENKVILLSRKPYQSSAEATSLVVGYHTPNDRADVSELIDAAKNVYAINVAVIPLNVLLRLVVDAVLHNRTITPDQLESLQGIVQ